MSAVTTTDGTTAYRIQILEKQIDELEKKVDRLVWALVMLSLSITASAIAFVITAASLKG